MTRELAAVETSHGVAFVDLAAIDAIGPRVTETMGGRTISMRLIYLRGGMGLEVLDTPENMATLFETRTLAHA